MVYNENYISYIRSGIINKSNKLLTKYNEIIYYKCNLCARLQYADGCLGCGFRGIAVWTGEK